jgi:flagellar basal-body rod protein FlgC
MKLMDTLIISGAGMKVQSDRLRTTAQNLANAESAGTRPGEEPYRRKTISFEAVMDRDSGVELVQTKRVGTDPSPFNMKYDPSHPAADAQGYVKMPNVNPLMEMMDMREARRSYEANMNMVESSRAMMTQTINLLQ